MVLKRISNRLSVAIIAICALFFSTVSISAEMSSADLLNNEAVGQNSVQIQGNLLAQADTAPAAEAPAAAAPAAKVTAESKINAGRTAWMLVSCVLVLLMIPGLALFYGGMVRSKNILNTVMLSLIAMAVIGVEWVLIGYNMAFGETLKGGIFEGILGWTDGGFALGAVQWDAVDAKGVPEIIFVMFQGMFAIITPALISGGIAERVKFSTYVVFILLWGVLIYNPLCHMVWNGDGILFGDGVLDFAGGTVVHISAGFSALVLAAFFLKQRQGYPEDTISPSSLVLTLLGAGLLWAGWFGFNAGSAIAFDDVMSVAAIAFGTTQVSAAAAALSWVLIEWIIFKKPTAVGFASGVVAGLVAITPAAGHVSIGGALVMGFLAGGVCFMGVALKSKLGYDDSLDCFGVHGIGGLFGALMVGVIGSINGAEAGGEQFFKQLIGALVGIGLSVIGTFIIAFILDKTMGFRVERGVENLGLDQTMHGEQGYRLH